ncbi:MFS antiporter Qdrp1 [[Candida] anglica]|uniref:MFS antiporter Qdrp1 n=1 Tax=[Candida] anglica TaxID=148631 RepID=A0ABP0EMI7_9ASCO
MSESSSRVSSSTLDEGPQEDVDIPPYSIINPTERVFFVVLLSLVGLWSTMSSPIYFPALPVLSQYFKVSEPVMNLSVVAYLLSQGIAPTFSSNFADTIGRRPVILVSLVIFIAACIGLSQTDVYWLLAVLRCVQAAGIAPVIAINSGIGGDITTRAERGGFVGIISGVQLMGNGFGGLIGSGLMASFDWRAIFIFLAIGGGCTLIVASVFLPETKRSIVGNCSIMPAKLINRSPILNAPFIKKRLTNDYRTLDKAESLDLLAPFRILIKRSVVFTLFACGLQFAAWTMVLTSISTVLEKEYHYSILHVGLIYLPQGIACLVASIITGRFLNWYYCQKKSAYDKKYASIDPSERPPFNIYRTRLDVLLPGAIIMTSGLLIFGWCLEYKQHIISIIISSCMISFSASSFMAAGTTMLVDLYPGKGSTSTSCLNLVRCSLAAVGTGVLSNLTSAMGVGGCYTLMAGFCAIAYILLVVVVLYSGTPTDTKIDKS